MAILQEENDMGNNSGVIDWSAAIGVCGGEKVLKEIAAVVVKDGHHCIETIAEAIEAGDSQKVRLYSHRLKGSGKNVGARQLVEKAYLLECAGEKEDVEAWNSLFEDVRCEFEAISELLSSEDWMERAKAHSDIS